ncbi:MAG: PEP-CTERM sorting domain-containing protein, partial [Phycisphaerae bacterium]
MNLLRFVGAAVVPAVLAMPAWADFGYHANVIGLGEAVAINNNCEVVGITNPTWSPDGFYWTPTTGYRNFRHSYLWCYPTDITDGGLVCGYDPYERSYGLLVYYSPWFYNPRTSQFLSMPSVDRPMAVNDHGSSAGQEYVQDLPNGTDYRAAVYFPEQYPGDPTDGLRMLGSRGTMMVALNELDVAIGGSRIESRHRTDTINGGASDINDYWHNYDLPRSSRGRIVGSSGGQACYWDSALNIHFLNPGGDDTGSHANAVSNVGEIVGTVQLASGARSVFRYANGAMQDLNALITNGVTIDKVNDINDRGWICARAYIGGVYRAVVLIPSYFAGGNFQTGSLDDWTVAGSGSAAVIEVGPGQYSAELTAGSPVTLSQEVATPVDKFELAFDYEFLSTDPTCTLTVEIEDVVVATLTAPDTLVGDWTRHATVIDDPTLTGLDPAVLELTYDGPTGTQLLLDNIEFTQLPEPATLSLLALGGLALLRRRRRA